MLKAVIDTSVFISGLINSRSSRRIIVALENSLFIPVLSPATLKELLDVLARAKFRQVIDRAIASRLVETLKAHLAQAAIGWTVGPVNRTRRFGLM